MADTRARIVIAAEDQTSTAFAKARAGLAGLHADAARIGGVFSGLGAQIAAAFSVAGIASFIKRTTDGIDQLNDLADATGASIENLSALEDVAARTGTSFETVGSALVKLNQALLSAKPGSDVADTLKALGLSVNELKRLDPAQALLEIAKAFQGFAADGNTARASQTLFGKSLREVAPLLKDLANAGQLVATVTADQAAEAEKFNQQLFALQKNATDVGRTIVGGLLPSLNAIVSAFAAGEQGAKSYAGAIDIVRVPLEALAILAANVAFTFGGVGREIGAIGAQMAALARGDLQGFRAISDAVIADGKRARAELDKFEQSVLRKVEALPTWGREARSPQLPQLQVPDTPAKQAKTTDLFGQYIEKLRDALRATQDLSTEDQARIDIAVGKLGKLTEAQRKVTLEIARQIDIAKAGDPLGDFIKNIEATRPQKILDDLKAISAQSAASKFDLLVEKVAQFREAQEAGRISTEDYVRGLSVIGEQFDAMRPKIEATADKVSEFALEASRNIQDALGDTLTRALEGDFRTIGELWLQLLRRMVAQALALRLNQYLFGDALGGGKDSGAWGGLLAGIGSLFGGARAMGGPVNAGTAYLVGERGPEVIVPRQAGTVLPSGAAGGVNVTIVQHIGANVSRAEVAAAGHAAKEAAKAEIMELLRRRRVMA